MPGWFVWRRTHPTRRTRMHSVWRAVAPTPRDVEERRLTFPRRGQAGRDTRACAPWNKGYGWGRGEETDGVRRGRVSPFARATARTSALVLVGVDGARALVAYASGLRQFKLARRVVNRETPVYARVRLCNKSFRPPYSSFLGRA
jgi:hypothetical protein